MLSRRFLYSDYYWLSHYKTDVKDNDLECVIIVIKYYFYMNASNSVLPVARFFLFVLNLRQPLSVSAAMLIHFFPVLGWYLSPTRENGRKSFGTKFAAPRWIRSLHSFILPVSTLLVDPRNQTSAVKNNRETKAWPTRPLSIAYANMCFTDSCVLFYLLNVTLTCKVSKHFRVTASNCFVFKSANFLHYFRDKSSQLKVTMFNKYNAELSA